MLHLWFWLRVQGVWGTLHCKKCPLSKQKISVATIEFVCFIPFTSFLRLINRNIPLMTMNWKVPFSRRNDNWRNPLETHNISVSTKVTFGWRKTSVGYNKRIITALITEFCEIEFSCMTRLFTLVHVPFLCRNSSITNSVFEPDLFIMWFFLPKMRSENGNLSLNTLNRK